MESIINAANETSFQSTNMQPITVGKTSMANSDIVDKIKPTFNVRRINIMLSNSKKFCASNIAVDP